MILSTLKEISAIRKGGSNIWRCFINVQNFRTLVWQYALSFAITIFYGKKLVSKKLGHPVFLTLFWHFWGPGRSWGAQTASNAGCKLVPDAPDGTPIAQMARYEPIWGIFWAYISCIFPYIIVVIFWMHWRCRGVGWGGFPSAIMTPRCSMSLKVGDGRERWALHSQSYCS